MVYSDGSTRLRVQRNAEEQPPVPAVRGHTPRSRVPRATKTSSRCNRDNEQGTNVNNSLTSTKGIAVKQGYTNDTPQTHTHTTDNTCTNLHTCVYMLAKVYMVFCHITLDGKSSLEKGMNIYKCTRTNKFNMYIYILI